MPYVSNSELGESKAHHPVKALRSRVTTSTRSVKLTSKRTAPDSAAAKKKATKAVKPSSSKSVATKSSSVRATKSVKSAPAKKATSSSRKTATTRSSRVIRSIQPAKAAKIERKVDGQEPKIYSGGVSRPNAKDAVKARTRVVKRATRSVARKVRSTDEPLRMWHDHTEDGVYRHEIKPAQAQKLRDTRRRKNAAKRSSGSVRNVFRRVWGFLARCISAE